MDYTRVFLNIFLAIMQFTHQAARLDDSLLLQEICMICHDTRISDIICEFLSTLQTALEHITCKCS